MCSRSANLGSRLGLALRAGKLAWGLRAVLLAAQQRRAHLVLLSCDAGERVRHEVLHHGLSAYTIDFDKTHLGASIGKDAVAVVAITDEGLAASVRNLMDS